MVCEAEGLCFKVIGRPVSQVLPPTDGLGTGPTTSANLITPKTVLFQFTELALTNFRIKYLKSEVLIGVRVTSCGTWRREKTVEICTRLQQGCTYFPPKKSSPHLKVPNTRRAMWSQFHTEDLQILSFTVQVSQSTRRPGARDCAPLVTRRHVTEHCHLYTCLFCTLLTAFRASWGGFLHGNVFLKVTLCPTTGWWHCYMQWVGC